MADVEKIRQGIPVEKKAAFIQAALSNLQYYWVE